MRIPLCVYIAKLYRHREDKDINSTERREARYRRRKAKREKKKVEANALYTYENATSFKALRKAYYKARKGVGWKASVQKYGLRILRNSYVQSRRIKNGENITKGFVEFDINERGKMRHIMSVHISERVAQKAVSINALVPLMERSLIYDNGASQKDKGTEFSAKRCIRQLHRWYRLHGNEGYILVGDGHDYFHSMIQSEVRTNMEKQITDKRTVDLIMQFITPIPEGLSLGSEVNQINAVAYANDIDHYITGHGMSFYNHYMDDWYIICETKEEAKEWLETLTKMYADKGITLNLKKTRIIKLSHGFTWLKDRYFLTDTGKVIRKPDRKNIYANRKKLKKLAKKYYRGEISFKSVEAFAISHRGYLSHKNANAVLYTFDKLYNELMITPFKEGRDYVFIAEQEQSYHSNVSEPSLRKEE